MKFETEDTRELALNPDWLVGVVKALHSFFNWLVSKIVTAGTILPTYFRTRGGAVLCCACAQPRRPHPVVQEPVKGRDEEVLVLVVLPFEAESRNKVAISLTGLGGRNSYDKFVFAPSYWTSHPGSPPGVTCVLPTVLEPVSGSLYPGLSVPIVLRAQQ